MEVEDKRELRVCGKRVGLEDPYGVFSCWVYLDVLGENELG